MKFCGKILLPIFSLALVSCTQTRSPASAANREDYLRVGARPVVDPSNRMVLLGIDRQDRVTGAKLDIRPLGFRGDDLSQVDPKFLMTVNKWGVQKVYSFELGNFPKMMTTMCGGSKNQMMCERQAHPEQWSDLPMPILDVPNAKQSQMLVTAVAVGLTIAKFSPLAPIAVLAEAIIKQGHRERSKVAGYLQAVVDATIDENRFPDLQKTLTRQQIIELGAALNIRYNPQGRFAGTFIPNDERVNFYDAVRQLRSGEASSRMGELVKMANEQGLVVVPMGTKAAMLFYEKDNLAPKDHWRATIIDADYPDALDPKIPDVSFKKGQLVPLALFSLDVKGQPLQMVDFKQPLKQAVRDRIRNINEFAVAMGGSLLPFYGINIGIYVSNSIVHFVIKKQGETLFDDRAHSYGELQAMLETGIAKMPKAESENVIYEAFLQDAAKWNFPPEKIESLRARYRSKDTALQQSAREEILEWFSQKEMRATDSLGMEGENDENVIRNKRIHIARLQKFIESNREMASLDRSLTKRALKEDEARKPRSPSSVQTETKPVILFMVDGFRPDRFRDAAKRGIIPNMARYFQDSGVQFNSFVSRSLTLPSWGTILTGFEPDSHGLRSNTPASRDGNGMSKSFLDFRKDLIFPKYVESGQSARHLKESGRRWLPEYFNKDEVLMNYLPINDGNYPPVFDIAKTSVIGDWRKLVTGIFEGAIELDKASGVFTSRVIAAKPGQHRLVINWYSSIDHYSHENNALLDEAMKTIDVSIGQVLEAARHDPVLKDASLVLVSDHGHSGGFDLAHKHLMNNTGFNLTTYFAGDWPANNPNDFTVLMDSSPNPTRDIVYLREFMIQPFEYVFRGRKNNPGKPNMIIDYSGDKLAQAYIKRPTGWGERLSFHEISRYPNRKGEALNIPEGLLQMRLTSIEVVDESLREKVKTETEMHPVEFFAMPLPGAKARASADAFASSADTITSTRDPIILRHLGGKTGLILTSHLGAEDQFRYVVLKNFSQDADGTLHGEVSKDASDDPLGYIGKVAGAEDASRFRSDREWLDLCKNHLYPTAIFFLPRALTLDPGIGNIAKRQAEIPDFLLIARYGFNFNSSDHLESDHGGLTAEEGRNTFVVSRLKNPESLHYTMAARPVLSRDVVPTILDLSEVGSETDFRALPGQSLKPILMEKGF